MNNNSESIEALNDLIQINNDRISGYQLAIDEMQQTNHSITAAIFEQYKKDSAKNVAELSEHVVAMGGEPSTASTLGGNLHRMWMDIKSTFAVHEKESTLEACVFGDEAAIKSYESCINDTGNNFSPEQMLTLNSHLLAIKATHAANALYQNTLEKIND